VRAEARTPAHASSGARPGGLRSSEPCGPQDCGAPALPPTPTARRTCAPAPNASRRRSATADRRRGISSTRTRPPVDRRRGSRRRRKRRRSRRRARQKNGDAAAAAAAAAASKRAHHHEHRLDAAVARAAAERAGRRVRGAERNSERRSPFGLILAALECWCCALYVYGTAGANEPRLFAGTRSSSTTRSRRPRSSRYSRSSAATATSWRWRC